MARPWKFNLISNLLLGKRTGATMPVLSWKALTLAGQLSIRRRNGGGRDPAAAVLWASPDNFVSAAFPIEHPKKQSVSVNQTAGFISGPPVIGHCHKDI